MPDHPRWRPGFITRDRHRAPPSVTLEYFAMVLNEDLERGCELTTIDIHVVAALLRYAMHHGVTTVGDLSDDV